MLFRTDKFDLEEAEAEAIGEGFLRVCAEYDYTPSGKGVALVTFLGTLATIEISKLRAWREERAERDRRAAPPAATVHPLSQPQGQGVSVGVAATG